VTRPYREKAKRAASIRRPPDPPFRGQAGRCSLCGEAVSGRRRTWCSQACVDLWWIATTPRIAYYHLSVMFGDVCWVCFDEPGGEVDHVRPLWSLGVQERQQLRWWLPFNLQLIGPRCHKAKTAREAALRAAWRKGEQWPLRFLAQPASAQQALL
jgi:hypothetical protein